LGIDSQKSNKEFEQCLKSVKKINIKLQKELKQKRFKFHDDLNKIIPVSINSNYLEHSYFYLTWLSLSNLRKQMPETGELNKNNFFDKLLLDIPVSRIFYKTGMGENEYSKEIYLLKSLLKFGSAPLKFEKLEYLDKKIQINNERLDLFKEILEDHWVRNLLGINTYEGVTYYSKENFEELINWTLSVTFADYLSSEKFVPKTKPDIVDEYMIASVELRDLIISASEKSEYILPALLMLIEEKVL